MTTTYSCCCKQVPRTFCPPSEVHSSSERTNLHLLASDWHVFGKGIALSTKQENTTDERKSRTCFHCERVIAYFLSTADISICISVRPLAYCHFTSCAGQENEVERFHAPPDRVVKNIAEEHFLSLPQDWNAKSSTRCLSTMEQKLV